MKRQTNTIILDGYGCYCKIRNDAFCVEYDSDRLMTLYRGVHKIKQIILVARGGYVTYDAMKWLAQQDITMYLMDFNGELLQVLSPKQNRNARLCYLQFKAMENETGLSIAKEMIRLKTIGQITTLQKHPELTGQAKALETLENGLIGLHTISDVEYLRLVEGRLAVAYFACFADVKIKWDKTARRIVPEHWLTVGTRNSALSSNGDARHATNPYQSALNFALALLKAEVTRAINIAGLEPTVGYLHTYQEDGNKQSLVYDLVEPFRAVVDDMMLQLFQRTLKRGDVYQTLSGECRLNEELRRYILASCHVEASRIDRLCKWLRDVLVG